MPHDVSAITGACLSWCRLCKWRRDLVARAVAHEETKPPERRTPPGFAGEIIHRERFRWESAARGTPRYRDPVDSVEAGLEMLIEIDRALEEFEAARFPFEGFTEGSELLSRSVSSRSRGSV